MIKKIIFLLSFFSLGAFAQVGGEYTYQFLNLTAAPRQAALGGVNITNRDSDVNQAFHNPAAINEQMDMQVGLNFSRYFGALNYGSAGFVKSFDSQKNIFVGINYLNYGTLEGYDEFGFETGTFTGNEVALNLGYAFHFTQSNWHFGANTKFVFSNLESYSSFGVALDLGLLNVNEDSNFTYGFVVRNLGAQLSAYSETREKLPLDIVFALSKKLENVPLRWHISLDNLQKWDLSYSNSNRASTDLDGEISEENVSFFNNALRHVVLGIELFPDRNFNLRFGYNFQKGEELRIVEQRHFSGITAGFGFKVKRFKFDYSYARQTVAANTSLFGLSIDLK